MDVLYKAEVFFFISSVGFIILFILLAVLLFYLTRAARTFSRIAEKVEDDINKIGDTTKEMVEDMKDSTFFRFMSGKKKRKKN